MQLTLQLPDAGGVPIASPLDDELPGRTPGGSAASLELLGGPLVVDCPGVRARRPLPQRSSSGRCPWREEATGPSPTRGPSDVELGPDIRFAAHAVEMVVELLARGRLLPDLEFVAGHWRACWRPLIDGHDRGRIEALAWALPASFTAVRVAESNTDDPFGQLGPEPSDEVLRSLMWAVTDALARDLITPGHAEGPETGCRSDRRRCLAACARLTRRLPRWVRGRRVCATGRTACRVARHEERGGRSGTDLFSDRPSPR